MRSLHRGRAAAAGALAGGKADAFHSCRLKEGCHGGLITASLGTTTLKGEETMMKRLAVAGVAILALACQANATTVVLTFEGLANNQPVGNYYNGGGGGNYGITFASNALALIDADAGGSGNFGGEPSPDTILYFVSGTGAIMDVPAGFDTGFSFYYTSPYVVGQITVYAGLGGTGGVLASLVLPLTPSNGAPDPTGSYSPLLPIGVAFPGIAMSVNFGGEADQIGFDNITLGSETPVGVVPEPLTCAGLLMGIGGMVGYLRRRRAA